MKLTSKNVEKIFMDCLFKDEATQEEKENAIIVEGIMNNFGFDPQKIEAHEEDISSLLKQLPQQFRENFGGGWSFLNACMRDDGEQWTGLHAIQEQLLALGVAAGWAKIQLPRQFWSALPGGMPYFVVYENKNGVRPERIL